MTSTMSTSKRPTQLQCYTATLTIYLQYLVVCDSDEVDSDNGGLHFGLPHLIFYDSSCLKLF